MNPEIETEVRQRLISAEKLGVSALWKTYGQLTNEHADQWEYLCAIGTAAEERLVEADDGDFISAYLAMMDMVESLAKRTLDDPTDYHSFCKNRADWEEYFWRAVIWSGNL